MNDYCVQALDYLKLAFDRRRALFSYSTSLNERGEVTGDFRLPESLRYTINTYLGLSEAQSHGGAIEWLGDLSERVNEFLELHEDALSSAADRGLLLVLLAATEPAGPAVERSLAWIERAVARDEAVAHLNMQDLGWMLWGTCSWAGEEQAAALGERLFGLIREHYVHPATGLPRHSVSRYRAHTVSFGSIVYFLRAMHEYAEAFDSDEARELFGTAVRRVMGIQASDGGWPWMIDVRSGVPFDLYPIFTVHQDSMAMLFLFPAEQYGVPGVAESIERSLRWNFGENELGVRMVQSDPYPWIYRSIERAERWPRARRYLRGLGPPSSRHATPSRRLRINRECRSYHLGWVLFAWSDSTHSFPVEASYIGA